MVVLEKTIENPLDCKEIKPVNPKGNKDWIFTGKDWCWSWNSNTLATWWEELTPWKRLWCWARLKAGEGDDRGWDGWMASPTRWTWVWVSSGSWWWTGKPGVLQSLGSQRVWPDWVTELNGTELKGLACNSINGHKVVLWAISSVKIRSFPTWHLSFFLSSSLNFFQTLGIILIMRQEIGGLQAEQLELIVCGQMLQNSGRGASLMVQW